MGIVVKHLNYDIESQRILRDVSCSFAPGAITAVTGPSGCGKTTLLNCISGLLRPTSGFVEIDGREMTAWKKKTLLRFWQTSAAFVYQDHGIIEDKTVAYNISFTHPRYLLRKNRIPSKVLDTLETVGLRERSQEIASHLSGGERQRVGIARALYRNASYLFVDEPTASLDAENRRLVLRLLRISAQSSATVVMATHDEEAINFADQVFSLPG